MSIAHLGLAGDQRQSGDPQGSRGDRVPPHDLLAEQSAIGGMLLSKDAVADVIETVRGVDFYIPKHETIFDAVMTLYSHGEPTDVIAVTDELTKTGQLGRAGGAEYLHTLTALVPTAANAGFYASIVAEKAVLRRLVEAGTRIVQMGYASEGEVVDLVNNAQAEIYGVTGGVEAEDYVPLTEAVTTAIDEIEAARGRDGQMVGVPTGFTELDELTNGLHPGQLIIIAARHRECAQHKGGTQGSERYPRGMYKHREAPRDGDATRKAVPSHRVAAQPPHPENGCARNLLGRLPITARTAICQTNGAFGRWTVATARPLARRGERGVTHRRRRPSP